MTRALPRTGRERRGQEHNIRPQTRLHITHNPSTENPPSPPEGARVSRSCAAAASGLGGRCRLVRFRHDARHVRFAACRPVPRHLSRHRVPVVHLRGQPRRGRGFEKPERRRRFVFMCHLAKTCLLGPVLLLIVRSTSNGAWSPAYVVPRADAV